MSGPSTTDKKNDKIEFADGFEPPLSAAEYAVEATQTLTFTDKTPTFTAKMTVHVSAPRYVLGPDEIYSVYPPAGQSGAFHTALAHIVFTRKTLPWERVIDAKANPEPDQILPPWMALLTFNDSELHDEIQEPKAGGPGASGAAEGKVRLHRVPLTELSKVSDDIQTPGLEREGDIIREGDPETCLLADIPTSLFQAVAPAFDELRYLAHARRVDAEDKDLADTVPGGWVSVVIGNRQPLQGERNYALLVSLEGCRNLLSGTRKSSQPVIKQARVRLIVLKYWTYTSVGSTFRQLLEGLTDSEPGKVVNDKDVWLRVPLAGADVPAAVRNALAIGYTAVPHTTRQNVQTVSWYRGPLIPQARETVAYHPTHDNADAALHYDDATGLFDVSYAAAWQLGRLVALQKADLANALLHERSADVTKRVLREANHMLEERPNGGAIDSQKAKLLLQDELMMAILADFWSADSDGGG